MHRRIADTSRRVAALLAALAAALLLAASAQAKTAFEGNGMWIWYVSQAEGGSLGAIVSKARAHDIRTVYIKAGDGTHGGVFSSQFRNSIGTLKAGGLKVCAWQYVYGDHPKDEAKVSAAAIKAGADCFVIDAEAQYEGKYSAARKYINRLRDLVGGGYPIALTGFPYVDYHPAFPYSVFLGPGAARYNLPQVYWKEISGGLDTVIGHTYRWNRPYGRSIFPLGQVYEGHLGRPSTKGIKRFRKYAKAEGAKGVSWWEWHFATESQWDALGAPISPFKDPIETEYATQSKGDRGDIVYWAQRLLTAAGHKTTADGDFGSATKSSVKGFQHDNGLPVTGAIDTATWKALLHYKSQAARAKVRAASVETTPRSATLPAKRYEIPPPAERRPR